MTASWHFGGMSKRPEMCRMNYFRERTCQETFRGAQAVAEAPPQQQIRQLSGREISIVIWSKRYGNPRADSSHPRGSFHMLCFAEDYP